MLAACNPAGSGDKEESRSAGGSVAVGLSQFTTLDPPRTAERAGLTILRTACNGLITLNPDTGKPGPGLVESWRVGAGAKSISLVLAGDLKFQDGSPVDATAVREGLSRVARPATSSPWSFLVTKVVGFAEVQSGAATHLTGVTVEDERRLSVELIEPLSDFPTLLGHPGLTPVSPKSLRDDPAGPNLPVCSGPYKIEAGANENELTLSRSSDLSPGSLPFEREGRGLAETLRIVGFESGEDAYEAYKASQVDIAPVPEARIGDAQGQVGFETGAGPEIAFLAFDTTKPPTSDKRLRQAISLAIERLLIIDAAFGDGRSPALRWLPEEFLSGEASCSSLATKVGDPARAKQLLAETGIDPGSIKLPLNYEPQHLAPLAAQAIQVQLRDSLGIDLVLKQGDAEAFSQSVSARSDAGVWAFTTKINNPVPGEFLASLFRTGGVSNALGFTEPQVDRPIDKAFEASNSKEFEKSWAEAESSVCEQMPAIPLWRVPSHWIRNPRAVALEGGALIDSGGGPLLRNVRAA